MNKNSTTGHVYIVGASIGGLVAASVLSKAGIRVSVIEKGKQVGGLYSKVGTPFGDQELGMHVLYVSPEIHAHLCEIFYPDTFEVLSGINVDLGSTYDFGRSAFNSVYPDLLDHPHREAILKQILEKPAGERNAENAHEEACRRFGNICADEVIDPILNKMWGIPGKSLTAHALHCYMDLRRVVVCEKDEADKYKRDAVLDDIIANPDQARPAGEVYGGRVGLRIGEDCGDLNERALKWAEDRGIEILFEKNIELTDRGLEFDDKPINLDGDACIVTVPVQHLAAVDPADLDQVELSIYYFATDPKRRPHFPAYYMLCHDRRLVSSRIVNYDAYHDNKGEGKGVYAVEVIHNTGAAPDQQTIAAELLSIFPELSIRDSYRFPHTLRLCAPDLKNADLLSRVENEIRGHFKDVPVFFTGMRTDSGIFFSHQTVGKAYDSALQCQQRFA